MAMTNHERVGKGMDWLRQGLAPFVEREVNDKVKSRAVDLDALRRFEIEKPYREWDAAALLKLMWETWNDIFRDTLGPTERSLVAELRSIRVARSWQRSFGTRPARRSGSDPLPRTGATSGPRSASPATTPTAPSTRWSGCSPRSRRPRRPRPAG